MERVTGVEPVSRAWHARILAVELHSPNWWTVTESNPARQACKAHLCSSTRPSKIEKRRSLQPGFHRSRARGFHRTFRVVALSRSRAKGKWPKQKTLRGVFPGGFNRSSDHDAGSLTRPNSFRGRRNRANFRACHARTRRHRALAAGLVSGTAIRSAWRRWLALWLWS